MHEKTTSYLSSCVHTAQSPNQCIWLLFAGDINNALEKNHVDLELGVCSFSFKGSKLSCLVLPHLNLLIVEQSLMGAALRLLNFPMNFPRNSASPKKLWIFVIVVGAGHSLMDLFLLFGISWHSPTWKSKKRRQMYLLYLMISTKLTLKLFQMIHILQLISGFSKRIFLLSIDNKWLTSYSKILEKRMLSLIHHFAILILAVSFMTLLMWTII